MERQTILQEILDLCIENGFTFETNAIVYRSYSVSHFCTIEKKTLFIKESSEYGMTLFELKERVQEYIKTLKQK